MLAARTADLRKHYVIPREGVESAATMSGYRGNRKFYVIPREGVERAQDVRDDRIDSKRDQ